MNTDLLAVVCSRQMFRSAPLPRLNHMTWWKVKRLWVYSFIIQHRSSEVPDRNSHYSTSTPGLASQAVPFGPASASPEARGTEKSMIRGNTHLPGRRSSRRSECSRIGSLPEEDLWDSQDPQKTWRTPSSCLACQLPPSPPVQEAGEPCTLHRRWQKRQRKPWARCTRWPEETKGWPHRTGSGKLYDNDIYAPDSCPSPSQMQAEPPSLLYQPQRWWRKHPWGRFPDSGLSQTSENKGWNRPADWRPATRCRCKRKGSSTERSPALLGSFQAHFLFCRSQVMNPQEKPHSSRGKF